MRDIKFRAWDKVSKTMYTDAINNCVDSFDLILKYPQVYEVMEYTGLKDKNGVEIYEGDIVEGGYLNPLTGKFVSKKYEVEYRDSGFYGKLIGHSPYGDTWLHFIKGEIIGNIYRNKDLLEDNRNV
ncbi:YopX family protein [Clostridium sp. MT-14]|uniref:YopX family protein n=1 Tax=Clostridium sp. MT-14 TaxID=3348360 RepID=UPI0035F380D4